MICSKIIIVSNLGNKNKYMKYLGFLFINIVFLFTIYYMYKLHGHEFVELFRLLESGDQEAISEYLNRQGQWQGMLSVFFISILQVVSIIIPGMAIQIAAGLIFGWWRAFIATYLGFVAGNLLVFLIVRHLGNRIQGLFDDDSEKEVGWLMSKINNANSTFVIALACLVPGVPNGIIPYVAAKTDITKKDFTFAIAASCWIQILLNCITGYFIVKGILSFVIISFALQIVFIIYVTTHRDQVIEYMNNIRGRKHNEKN